MEGRATEMKEGFGFQFIKDELIPDMVCNRCFCDPGSREFVEFESAVVSSLKIRNEKDNKNDKSWRIYESKAVIQFSGEPVSFSLVVKILDDPQNERAYNCFLNEEMFYSKMAIEYNLSSFARCYASDMGRYGVPVIVMEDLRCRGYERINGDGKLNEAQLKASLEALGAFHGRGLYLKNEKHGIFREFSAKLVETFDEDSMVYRSKITARILEELADRELSKKMKARLGAFPMRTALSPISKIDDLSTICHGHFSRDNLLFKQENHDDDGDSDGDGNKGIDVRMIDWQTMRYSSPIVDLAPILFSNLPGRPPGNLKGPPSSKAHHLWLEEMLTYYLRPLNRELNRDSNRHSCEITVERIKREIISKAIHAYVISSFGAPYTDNELVETFTFLDTLGAFD